MIILALVYLVTAVLNFYLFYKWVGEISVFQLIFSLLFPPAGLFATILTYGPTLTIPLRKKK